MGLLERDVQRRGPHLGVVDLAAEQVDEVIANRYSDTSEPLTTWPSRRKRRPAHRPPVDASNPARVISIPRAGMLKTPPAPHLTTSNSLSSDSLSFR